MSLYNETDGRPILPTPTVAIVGQLASADDRLGLAFASDGAVVALLGKPGRGHLGGSEWLTRRTGRVTGEAPRIDLAAEVALQHAVLALARGRVLESAHDVSDGGLAVCVAESCIAGRVGARLRLPGADALTTEAVMFGEDPSRVVVSFLPTHVATVQKLCAEHRVPYTPLGAVGGDALSLEGYGDVPVAELAEAHENALVPIVGAE